MKRTALMFSGLAFLFSAGSTLRAQVVAKDVKIEAILRITHSDTVADQVLNQFKNLVTAQLPPGTTPEQAAKLQELQTKLFDVLKSRFSMDKVMPQYIKIYSDTFSDEEIDGIYAFYNSPAGYAFINKMPLMLPKLMELFRGEMSDITPEIERIMKESVPARPRTD